MRPARYSQFPEDLAALLLDSQLVNKYQLEQAQRFATHTGTLLIDVAIEHALVMEETLTMLLQQRLQLPFCELGHVLIDPEAVRHVPQQQAEAHQVFPFAMEPQGTTPALQLAMADPLDWRVIEEISYFSGLEVEPHIARPSDVRAEIARAYHRAVTRVIHRQELDQAVKEVETPALRTSTGLNPGIATTPNLSLPTFEGPSQGLAALVALLVSKGLVTQEEYESQLAATAAKHSPQDD